MARGGARPGAGVKPTWKHGKTRTIRVPIVLADELMRIARYMDENGLLEYDTGSKTVNLSGISIRQHEGAIAIRLEDLVKIGYTIQPETLSQFVKARLEKLEIDKRLKHGNNQERRERGRILHH